MGYQLGFTIWAIVGSFTVYPSKESVKESHRVQQPRISLRQNFPRVIRGSHERKYPHFKPGALVSVSCQGFHYGSPEQHSREKCLSRLLEAQPN
jgi:hypothetical protein